jgi:hypothetical protein
MLTIAAHKWWSTALFDVKTVFLHSEIDNNVWVLPPPGCDTLPGKVWKLKKDLYGTKQAGRCWWLHLKMALESVGFSASAKDQSTYVFRSGSNVAFFWIHVNDGLLLASLEGLKGNLKVALSGVKWDKQLVSLVGIKIRETQGSYWLQKPALTEKLLAMVDSSDILLAVPLANKLLESNPLREPDKLYLLYIGVLLYLAQGTWPDILFVTHHLAWFSLKNFENLK